ncbi:MAG TPA: cyclase family protein [Nocardioidaceae bacterium]|nr:cyclase family protein [Nocardioidaceae bacterium]
MAESGARRRRVVDLSHTIREGMTTYPGLPGPRIRTHVGRDDARAQLRGEASFHIGVIELVANTGTYLDTPFHFHERGADCATADVGRMVDLACVVVDVRGQRTIGPEMLPEGPLTGAAVLFRTDRSSLFGKPEYAVDSPFLTRPLVEALVREWPALVGIDALNVDDVDDPARPAHSMLLGAGIFVVEHLTRLAQVPARGARFTAVPAPVEGMGTMPVRAVAVLGGPSLGESVLSQTRAPAEQRSRGRTGWSEKSPA